MTNSYQWSINPYGVTSLDVGNSVLQFVYTKLQYSLIATDPSGIFTASYHDQIDLDPPDVSNFIPANNVTNPIIVEWLLSKISNTTIEEIKSNLDLQLSFKINPPLFNGNVVIATA